MKQKLIEATVSKVQEGPHGAWVVTRPNDPAKFKRLGSITFSLSVWREKGKPEPGHVVLLGSLNRKTAGWRANSARFFKPEDEEQ